VPGNATFRVRVDGEPVHQVENVKGGAVPRPLTVEVAGKRELTLEVDFGADFHLGDRADWLGALFQFGDG
jgi:hypothetical protein